MGIQKDLDFFGYPRIPTPKSGYPDFSRGSAAGRAGAPLAGIGKILELRPNYLGAPCRVRNPHSTVCLELTGIVKHPSGTCACPVPAPMVRFDSVALKYFFRPAK